MTEKLSPPAVAPVAGRLEALVEKWRQRALDCDARANGYGDDRADDRLRVWAYAGQCRACADELATLLAEGVAPQLQDVELASIYAMCRHAGMTEGSNAADYLRGVFYLLNLKIEAGTGIAPVGPPAEPFTEDSVIARTVAIMRLLNDLKEDVLHNPGLQPEFDAGLLEGALAILRGNIPDDDPRVLAETRRCCEARLLRAIQKSASPGAAVRAPQDENK